MSLQLLEPLDPQDPREQPVSDDARPAPELASLSGRVAQQAIDDETYARQTAKLDLMLLIEVIGYDAMVQVLRYIDHHGHAEVMRWVRHVGACLGRVE
jgi:hypothetical protein